MGAVRGTVTLERRGGEQLDRVPPHTFAFKTAAERALGDVRSASEPAGGLNCCLVSYSVRGAGRVVGSTTGQASAARGKPTKTGIEAEGRSSMAFGARERGAQREGHQDREQRQQRSHSTTLLDPMHRSVLAFDGFSAWANVHLIVK